MSVFVGNVQLEIIACANCGVSFALTSDFIQRRRNDNKDFYCPSGHVNAYREDMLDRLKEENDRLRSQVESERHRREAAAKLHDTAIKGERIKRGKAEAKVARIETRVNAGVCPHCQRTFQQLARHMQTKHADLTPHRHGSLP